MISPVFDVGAGVPRRRNRGISSALSIITARKNNHVAAQDVHDGRTYQGHA